MFQNIVKLIFLAYLTKNKNMAKFHTFDQNHGLLYDYMSYEKSYDLSSCFDVRHCRFSTIHIRGYFIREELPHIWLPNAQWQKNAATRYLLLSCREVWTPSLKVTMWSELESRGAVVTTSSSLDSIALPKMGTKHF